MPHFVALRASIVDEESSVWYLRSRGLEVNLVKQLLFSEKIFSAESIEKVVIFYRLRWGYVLFILLGNVLGFFLGHVNSTQYTYFLLLVLGAVLFNVATSLKVSEKRNLGANFLLGQITFDLFFVFAALYLMGISQKPLISFLLVPFILGVYALDIFRNTFLLFLNFGLMYFLFRFPLNSVLFIPSETLLTQTLTTFIIWFALNFVLLNAKSNRTKLEQIKNAQGRMDQLKIVGSMTSGFCHEIATPLNSLKINLERLVSKEEYLADSILLSQKAIERIENSLKELTSIHLEEQKTTQVNIKSLLSQLVNKQVTYQDNNNRQDIFIEVHEASLRRTLIDILENALMAAGDTGEVKLELTILAEKFVEIKCRNSGECFPEKVLKHLGEPFLTFKKNGNGLGLFNAYNFMILSGGEIHLRNTENNEAEVRLLFPLISLQGIK